VRLVRPRSRPAVLVVKPDSLGDALLFTGALRKLREHHRDHEIVVACSKRAYPIYDKLSTIDRIVIIDPSDKSVLGRVDRICSAVRLHALNLSLLLHPVYSTSTVAHVLCRKLKAEKKVWFQGDASYGEDMAEDPRSIYDVLVECERDVHELDKTVTLLKAIGVPVSSRADIRPDLELTDAEKAKAKSIIAPLREQDPGTLVMALCAGARFKMKDWGAERFVALICGLADQLTFSRRDAEMPIRQAQGLCQRTADTKELIVLLLGSAEERGRFEEIQKRTTGPQDHRTTGPTDLGNQEPRTKNQERGTVPDTLAVMNLAGSLTVRETAAVIAESDLCVGNDTFGLHAAAMVGTPSVVIMGGGDFPRWAPWGDPSRHRTANKPMDCYGCGWVCRHSTYRCIEEVTGEHVLDCAQGLRQRGADEFSRGDAEVQRRPFDRLRDSVREILLPTNHTN